MYFYEDGEFNFEKISISREPAQFDYQTEENNSNTINESDNQENNEINNSNFDKENETLKSNKFTESNLENFPTGYSSNLSEDEYNFESNNFTKRKKIFNITKKSRKKILGRKRQNNMAGKHNKFSYDNMVRKLKSKFFEALLKFINESMIEEPDENDKFNGKKKKAYKPFLLKLEKNVNISINVKFNQKLINTKIREIFSNNIYDRGVSKYGKDYNKNKITKIYNEKIQVKAIGILDMTFLQCLEQWRGTGQYIELKGLEKKYPIVINSLKEKKQNNGEYIELFKKFVESFETYYENKSSREKI